MNGPTYSGTILPFSFFTSPVNKGMPMIIEGVGLKSNPFLKFFKNMQISHLRWPLLLKITKHENYSTVEWICG